MIPVLVVEDYRVSWVIGRVMRQQYLHVLLVLVENEWNFILFFQTPPPNTSLACGQSTCLICEAMALDSESGLG